MVISFFLQLNFKCKSQEIFSFEFNWYWILYDSIGKFLFKPFLGEAILAQMVKNPPAVQETWVWSLGWEDHLEKEMAIHSSILAWIVPWTEEPGRLQSMGLQIVGCDWVTHTFTFINRKEDYILIYQLLYTSHIELRSGFLTVYPPH